MPLEHIMIANFVECLSFTIERLKLIIKNCLQFRQYRTKISSILTQYSRTKDSASIFEVYTAKVETGILWASNFNQENISLLSPYWKVEQSNENSERCKILRYLFLSKKMAFIYLSHQQSPFCLVCLSLFFSPY